MRRDERLKITSQLTVFMRSKGRLVLTVSHDGGREDSLDVEG